MTLIIPTMSWPKYNFVFNIRLESRLNSLIMIINGYYDLLFSFECTINDFRHPTMFLENMIVY